MNRNISLNQLSFAQACSIIDICDLPPRGVKGIFLSYRREDSEGQSGRLYDDLVKSFGKDLVFIDVSGIKPGQDFRLAIDDQVRSCCVLLAIIGKDWLNAPSSSGGRRLDDPTDYVRIEISSALKRSIPVIPVLVRGAAMPCSGDLPDDLVNLSYRNAVELTHARWDSDLQILINSLRDIIQAQDASASFGLEAHGKLDLGNEKPTSKKLISGKPTNLSSLDASVANTHLPIRAVITGSSIAAALVGVFIYSIHSGDQQVIRNTIDGNSADFARTEPPSETGYFAKSKVLITYRSPSLDYSGEKLIGLLTQRGYRAQFIRSNIKSDDKVLLVGSNVPLPYVKDIAKASVVSGIRLYGIFKFCGDPPESQESIDITSPPPNVKLHAKLLQTTADVDIRDIQFSPGC